MIPRDLFFAHPSFAILMLAAVPFLLLFAFSAKKRQQALSPFQNTHLQQLLATRSKERFWLKAILFTLAWVCAVFAIMQPKGNRTYIEPEGAPKTHTATGQRKAHEVILLLDTSSSMEVKDTRGEKSRLDYAKEIADQIVDSLQGPTVSLYSFTSQLLQLIPPTPDYLFVRLMLRQVDLNEGGVVGTDFQKTLSQLHEDVIKPFPQKLKTLIIISDGDDTALEGVSKTEKEKFLSEWKKLLKPAHVITIGIGSQGGAIIPEITYEDKPVLTKLDEQVLKGLATEGNYFNSNGVTAPTLALEIKSLVDKQSLLAKENETFELEGIPNKGEIIYDLYFQYPLALAIIFLLLGLYIPDNKSEKRKNGF